MRRWDRGRGRGRSVLVPFYCIRFDLQNYHIKIVVYFFYATAYIWSDPFSEHKSGASGTYIAFGTKHNVQKRRRYTAQHFSDKLTRKSSPKGKSNAPGAFGATAAMPAPRKTAETVTVNCRAMWLRPRTTKLQPPLEQRLELAPHL